MVYTTKICKAGESIQGLFPNSFVFIMRKISYFEGDYGATRIPMERQ